MVLYETDQWMNKWLRRWQKQFQTTPLDHDVSYDNISCHPKSAISRHSKKCRFDTKMTTVSGGLNNRLEMA